MEYRGLHEIKGSIVVLKCTHSPAYEEIVTIETQNQPPKTGRVIQIDKDIAVVLVFEGVQSLSLRNTITRFTGEPFTLAVSEDILGRVFDGMGRAIDGLGKIYSNTRLNINGKALNPALRAYPRRYIHTGISAIDGLVTLVRGQKLPIFSADGMPHNALAVQIARQASFQGDNFAIVFAAMGVKGDTAEYFRQAFEESGAARRAVMFLNLAKDPAIERIITPRCALTTAEYLAYNRGMHVIVVLTDMTAYAEALREISAARGEMPSRKGYPGYMYSDLASIYERAGVIKNNPGSITQIPILTMPGDDITHPIADLTGYITEGQIVLDRALHQRGIYPPINILPSLSRLMKDGIGKGLTRADHPDLAWKLFSSYARVGDARAIATVVGEDELSDKDRGLLEFGHRFEHEFISQSRHISRSLDCTLGLGWEILDGG